MDDFTWYIYHSDCLEVLKRAPDAYFDSVVTDPPGGIDFMHRSWDSDRGGRDKWIGWLTEIMREAHRVLKPGAHALVWAIPRTSHWTATAIEDAGFEVRDCIVHHYSQGFPKSRDIGKDIGEPWIGWGTSLKPASEFWVLARKSLAESSIARNVLQHGTGALNIDGCRVERAEDDVPGWHKTGSYGRTGDYLGEDTFKIRDMPPEEVQERCGNKGRWPTNLLLSHSPDCGNECTAGCPVAEMDRQSGTGRSRKGVPRRSQVPGDGYGMVHTGAEYDDSGGASRFFPTFRYQAKPSRSERETGLDQLPERTLNRVNPGGLENEPRFAPVQVKNNHPTVKGVALMRWLCRLITPPGGLVLDPFCGSGSTGIACLKEGLRFIGIEQDEGYCEISRARILAAQEEGEG